jgi:hypothetical protein
MLAVSNAPSIAASGTTSLTFPLSHHGQQLASEGLFEPINLIVSGQSDAFILTEEGFLDYARSIGFSFECLRQHRGGYQQANLGDGKGWENELFELREVLVGADPGDWIGTCVESFTGGNHFRGMSLTCVEVEQGFRQLIAFPAYHCATAWQQNGSAADTGAWFLAVSKEKVSSRSSLRKEQPSSSSERVH